MTNLLALIAEYNPAAQPVAWVIACTLAGALARPGLGGKWARPIAVLVMGFCALPAAWVYFVPAKTWGDGMIGGLVIALLFSHLVWRQYFAVLWEGFARYSIPVIMLAMLTGCAWVLPTMLPQFLALKWARHDDPDVRDEHRVFEVVLGICMGFAWGAAPLLRGW